MHWLAVALAKVVSPCWTSQWDTEKQRFKVNLGSRPGQTKTSWVNKLSTHHQHVRARCSTWVTPDQGFVVSLPFSLKAVCGTFFSSSSSIPRRKHTSHAALSAPDLSAALWTRSAVRPSADESQGTVQKTRWDTWRVQRSGVGRACGVALRRCNLYLRCLADATDSGMQTRRRLEGNMQTNMRLYCFNHRWSQKYQKWIFFFLSVCSFCTFYAHHCASHISLHLFCIFFFFLCFFMAILDLLVHLLMQFCVCLFVLHLSVVFWRLF